METEEEGSQRTDNRTVLKMWMNEGDIELEENRRAWGTVEIEREDQQAF